MHAVWVWRQVVYNLCDSHGVCIEGGNSGGGFFFRNYVRVIVVVT